MHNHDSYRHVIHLRYHTEPKPIVVVEPRLLTPGGIQQLLERAVPGSHVVAVAGMADIEHSIAPMPATVLLSSAALDDGRDALAHLDHPDTRVILVVFRKDVHRLAAAARLPVDVVLYEQDISEGSLAEAFRILEDGTRPMSRTMIRALLRLADAADAPRSRQPAQPTLSAREKDTLRLMCGGLGNKAIARAMSITEHGVKRHVANVLAKLGCENRTMAVAVALQNGLAGQADPNRL